MKIKTFQVLEWTFKGLSNIFRSLGDRCSLCPDCGANRYTGKPCVILTPINPCEH